ncbi:MAG: SRPBCC domain-containing protein, partial [Pseudomonadota bacterium]
QKMGMPDDFPDVTEVIVELSSEGDQTRMVMVHVGVEEGTAGAGGWNQAFDKMGVLIAKLSNAGG